MSDWELIGRGSSKDLYRHVSEPDALFFEFSDRVSVFDYGALPDLIPGKGAALLRSAKYFFALFRSAGLATAYDAALTETHGRCALRAARHPKFKGLAQVETSLTFIPLEIIFRWGATPGSSWLKRHPDQKPYARFDRPLVEFSTKLEATDRMLGEMEARELVGERGVFDKLRVYAERAAEVLRDDLKSCGLELWDGKIECAVDTLTGEIHMVDALTPDELRVTLPGLEDVALSKELLRQWIGGTDWAFDVAHVKSVRGDDWRVHVSPPPRLGAWRVGKLSSLYMAFADACDRRTAKPLLEWVRSDRDPPKVFVLGNGGRESAMKWRLEREGCEIVMDATTADVVWVSQDSDLDAGKVDTFSAQGAWTYGPRAAAAKIESSKSFGKAIAGKAEVPVPRFTDDPTQLKTFASPPVVKCDGLAAGKGVVVPKNWAEAEAALKEFSARGPVLLEERCRGFEASAFFAIETGYQGLRCRFLGTAQDFKRRFAGDEGPNTGGMGAYAPHPKLSPDDVALFRGWAERTAQALMREHLPYNGILYLGCLKDEQQGWVLLEYNARLGDPETEALVCAWDDAPLLRSLLKLDVRAGGRDACLDAQAICVALVRRDYPTSAKSPPSPLPEWDLPPSAPCVLFKNEGGSGRVAFVVGRGEDLFSAGDRVFGCLVESPWKHLLDWRADILP